MVFNVIYRIQIYPLRLTHSFVIVANPIVFDTTRDNYLKNWKTMAIFAP